MSKLRWSALGLAVVSVGLMATPAAAAKVVYRNTGKDATAVVTDCPASPVAGTKCIAWVAYASQNRENNDGTISRSGGLGLDKYRVKFTDPTTFTTTLVATGFTDNNSLVVPDNLSTATASGVVPVLRCDKRGRNCTTTNMTVSFSLTANAPADFFKDRTVTKLGSCRTVERFNSYSRTADGSGTINGVTLPTQSVVPSTIGSSLYTNVARNCTPQAGLTA
jgi:hypothetical protein